MIDNDVVVRIKAGDREAFDILVEEYQAQVVNIAYGMLSNREDAFDAAQEVFIRIYKHIGGFRMDSALSTWIFKITKNVCTDFLRKRKDAVSLDVEDENKPKAEIEDRKHAPETAVERTETQRLVREAISQMEENYRLVITLFDIEGLSYEEIAAIIGCPVGTVKSRLARAREKLKQFFLKKREHIF